MDIQSLYDRGTNRFNSGDYTGAIEDFNQIIRINPSLGVVYYLIGLAYSELEQYPVAIKYYNESIRLYPTLFSAYIERSFAYNNLSKFKKSLQDLEKFPILFHNEFRFYICRGYANYGLKHYKQAIQDFQQAILLNPDISQSLNSLMTSLLIKETNFCFEQNDYSGAIENLNQAINLNPDNYFFYFYRSMVYQKQNDYNMTIEDLNQAINLNTHNYKLYRYRGAICLEQNDYCGAIENLTEAINLNPDDTELYGFRSRIRDLAGDVLGAIEDIERAININPSIAEYYFDLGCYLEEIEDFQRAIENYTKALEINPYLTPALFYRGGAYFDLGDFKEALEDYELMLVLHQDIYHSGLNSVPALLNLIQAFEIIYPYAVFYMRAYTRFILEDWNGAIEDFTNIICNPVPDKLCSHLNLVNELSELHYYRAIAYWHQRDRQKAIFDCNETINLNQELAAAYKIRGLILCEQGDSQKGIWNLQKAAKLYFEQGDLESSDSTLETIRSLDTPEETLNVVGIKKELLIDLHKRIQALEFEQLQRQLILDPVIRQNRLDLYKLQEQFVNIQPSIEVQLDQISNLQEEVTDIRLTQQYHLAKLNDLQQQLRDFQYGIAEIINANILDIEVLQLHMEQLELVISNVFNSESAAKQIIELNEYLERVNPQYQYKLLFNRYESHQIVKKALNQTKKQLIMVCPWLNWRVVQTLIKDFQKILKIGYIYVGYGYQGDINDLKRTGIKVTHLNLLKAAEKEGKAWKYDAIKHLLKLDKFKLRLALTHAKFLICDDEFAMFGSHNFLTSGPNKNERELGLFTTDPRIINQLIADFENADNVEEEN